VNLIPQLGGRRVKKRSGRVKTREKNRRRAKKKTGLCCMHFYDVLGHGRFFPRTGVLFHAFFPRADFFHTVSAQSGICSYVFFTPAGAVFHKA